MSKSQHKKRITDYYPPRRSTRSKINSYTVEQKQEDQTLEPEEIICSSKPAINFIESSLRESKTFENYLDDNLESYEEHFEESKEGERVSLIKTTTNSIESGCLEPAASPQPRDKDLDGMLKSYVDLEAPIGMKAST